MDWHSLLAQVRTYVPYNTYKQMGEGDYRDPSSKNPFLSLSTFGLYDFKLEKFVKNLAEIAIELGIEMQEDVIRKPIEKTVVDVKAIYEEAQYSDVLVNLYYKTRGLTLSEQVIKDVGFKLKIIGSEAEIINPIKNIKGEIVSLNRVRIDEHGNKLWKKKLGGYPEPYLTCFGNKNSKIIYCFEGLEDALTYQQKIDSNGCFLVVYSAGCWKSIDPFIRALNSRMQRDVRVILDPDDNCTSMKHSMKIEEKVDRFVPLERFDCNSALLKDAMIDWHSSLSFVPNENVVSNKENAPSLLDDVKSFKDVITSKEAGFVSMLEPILNERECVMLFAKPGAGKSFVTQRLAMCAASGAKFLKWQFKKPYRVVYLDGEMGIDTLKERSQMIVKTLGVTMLEENLSFLTTKPDGSTAERNISCPNVQAQFDEVFKQLKTDIFVIDNLMTTALPTGMKDDDMKVWERLQPWIISLKSRGITVILVHHTNKSGEEPRGDIKKDVIINAAIKLSPCPFEVAFDGSHISWEFIKTRSFYGKDGDPIYIKHVNNADGSLHIEFDDYQNIVEKEVGKLLLKGMSVVDISSKLNVPKWRIGEIKKQGSHESFPEEASSNYMDREDLYDDVF